MSEQKLENQGTGLEDVFDILIKAPPERLQSLTMQLGESPEDTIIHALCLVVLRQEAQALNKFQMLRDNCLANHLTQKLQMGGGNLEDFQDHCGRLEEATGETLTMLAQIFNVLSEQRLCDPPLRNLAYQRALSTNSQKKSNCGNVKFDHFLGEAKYVCGPQVLEGISLKDDPLRSLNEGNTTIKVSPCQDQSKTGYSLPRPLQASTLPSYPSHLEFSIPPTVPFQGDKRSPEPISPDKSRRNTPNVLVGECEAKRAPEQSQSFNEPQPKSNEPGLFKAKNDSVIDAASARECFKLESHKSPSQNTKPSTVCLVSFGTSTSTSLQNIPVPQEMHKSKAAEEKEGAIFYTFVILHAPEDAEMAENLRDRLEGLVGSKGAIFTDDFSIPGKSILRCVEDAINNSAFTLLLLTRNFNTRMLEVTTNSALVNAINNDHKYNTVIPLLPRKNSMPRNGIPMILSTISILEDDRSFEKRILKAMTPEKIEKIKNIWTEEQRVNIQKEKQANQKQINQIRRQLLERESLKNRVQCGEQHGCDSQTRLQQMPNIHIENAQYIMIGNDSQMTVDSAGGADREDLIIKKQSNKDGENF